MDSIVELSSDSSAPNSPNSKVDDEKFGTTSHGYHTKSSTEIQNDAEFDSDDDLPEIPLLSRILAAQSKPESYQNVQNYLQKIPYKNIEEVDDDSTDEISKFERDIPKRIHEQETDKEVKKQRTIFTKYQKQQEKVTRQMEKEKRKADAAKEKEVKKAMAIANKNLKPEECMKFMTVILDNNLIVKFGPEIFESIKSTEASSQTDSQIIPNTVWWKRSSVQSSVDENGKLLSATAVENINKVVLIMSWKEIVNLIDNKQLLKHIKSIKAALFDKKLDLITFGLENYFRFHKNQRNRECGGDKNKKVPTKDKIFKDEPNISRKVLEYAMAELQLLCNCNYRNVESSNEIGVVIMQFTKAIAQEPHKKEKQEQYKDAEWYISGDNKDCVRVDQNGNGLKRLWQQQLTMFPLARLETADAIISKYPCPKKLMTKYEDCSTGTEKEQLLQDIPIRRAAGPLATARKIGPELKRRLKWCRSTVHF